MQWIDRLGILGLSGAMVLLGMGCSDEKLSPIEDTTDGAALLATPTDAYAPSWSPEGELIAYHSFSGPSDRQYNIWVVPAPGGEATQITHLASGDFDPCFSFDGERIVFLSRRSGLGDLWYFPVGDTLVAPDTSDSTLVQVTRDPAEEIDPCWSPDGMRIAFASPVSGNWDLWMMTVGDSVAVQVTTHPARDDQPAWSPDGSQLAFRSNRDGRYGIFAIDLDEGRVHSLVTDGYDNYEPAWSPAGERLAFASDRNGNRDIWILVVGTGELLQLSRDPATDESPTWSPAGDQIAFGSDRQMSRGIWILPVPEGAP